MPNVRKGPQDYLLSGQTTSANGTPMDNRAAGSLAYLSYWSVGSSAIVVLDCSPDGDTGYLRVATLTALVTVQSAQYSAVFPWVRGGLSTGFNASTAFVHWSPILK